MTALPTFTLRVLGGAALHGPAGPVTGRAGQRRRLALLAVLALGGPRETTRDGLVALFWPESDDERARHSLADAAYQIRRDLGDEALLSRGDALALNPDVIGSDVAAFEAAIARGALREAVELYAGPLLDGAHLADTPEFERWVDGRRTELARVHARALERLAEEAARRGEPQEAVGWWRRLCTLDPYSARVALGLMAALDAAGDRAGAIRHARVHTALLEHELGAAPDPDVEALAERLRLGASAPAGRAPDVVVADAPEASTSSSSAPLSHSTAGPPPRRRTRRWLVAASLSAAAVVVATALVSGSRFSRAATRGEARSVVVLPCANVGGAAGDEHFSDGLTDELTALLAQVRSLRVVARTSAFEFKGRGLDVREIARRLDADAVVECGVRRAGDRFRVTAQLVDGDDGLHLWSDAYEREGTDLLALQGDLALRIARGLQATLTPSERSRLARRATAHPDAHALYLKGRHFWNQRTAGGVDRAIEHFARAIAIDSQYAAAHAGLARAYSLQAVLGRVEPRAAADRMRAAAARAIALDEGLADAHAELGAYYNIYAWDSQASERAFRRSLELDPGNAAALNLYSNLLFATGRLEETISTRRAAARLDPLTPQYSNALGHALLAAGRADEALAAYREAIDVDSAYWSARAGLGDYFAAAGRHEDAVREHRRAVALAREHVNARADLARALAHAGQREEARRIVADLRADGERRALYPPAIAFAMVALGDADGALAWLERGYAQKHPQLRLMRRQFEGALAGDPRYRDLLRRIGLPPSLAR